MDSSSSGEYVLRTVVESVQVEKLEEKEKEGESGEESKQQSSSSTSASDSSLPSFFVVVQVGDRPKQRSEVAKPSYSPSFHRSAFDFTVTDLSTSAGKLSPPL